MAKSVTMRDIAAEIGVSTVTVSKALTGREGVSDEVREKIKQKAAEMGDRYNSAAKAMKEGENGSIGILVADRFFEDNSFYNKLYRHLVLKLNCFQNLFFRSSKHSKSYTCVTTIIIASHGIYCIYKICVIFC